VDNNIVRISDKSNSWKYHLPAGCGRSCIYMCLIMRKFLFLSQDFGF